MNMNLKSLLILLITISNIFAAVNDKWTDGLNHISFSSMDTSYGMPCNGGGGSWINLDNTSCDTSTVSSKCPGGSNIKC